MGSVDEEIKNIGLHNFVRKVIDEENLCGSFCFNFDAAVCKESRIN